MDVYGGAENRAWLVTWEVVSGDDELAAVLTAEMPIHVVGQVIETIYANHRYTIDELIRWAQSPNENPYRARADEERGIVICGDIPYLEARIVESLRTDLDSDGNGALSWTRSGVSRTLRVRGGRVR